MQTPAYLTETANCSQYRYGAIDRITNGFTFSALTQSGTRFNLVNTAGFGGDPIISIPQSAKNYKYAELCIDIALYALISDNQVDANLVAWNYVGTNSAFIVIDGQPFTPQFTSKSEKIQLANIPSQINFSQFGLVATLLSAYNSSSFPVGGGATCFFVAYVTPIINMFN